MQLSLADFMMMYCNYLDQDNFSTSYIKILDM